MHNDDLIKLFACTLLFALHLFLYCLVHIMCIYMVNFVTPLLWFCVHVCNEDNIAMFLYCLTDKLSAGLRKKEKVRKWNRVKHIFHFAVNRATNLCWLHV